MSNLLKVVRQLRLERNQAQRRIEQLDEALKALTGFGRGRGGTKFHHVQISSKRRTMSAAARKKIAAAQRANGRLPRRRKTECYADGLPLGSENDRLIDGATSTPNPFCDADLGVYFGKSPVAGLSIGSAPLSCRMRTIAFTLFCSSGLSLAIAPLICSSIFFSSIQP